MFITATIISIAACAVIALVWNHIDAKNEAAANIKNTESFETSGSKAA